MGDGLANAVGIPDGEDHIADLRLSGLAESNRLQVVEFYAQHRQVGFWIGTDQSNRCGAAIVEHAEYFFSAVDNMVIGQDVTIATHDNPGPQRSLWYLSAANLRTKHRMLCQWVFIADRRYFERVDVDHRRCRAANRLRIRNKATLGP